MAYCRIMKGSRKSKEMFTEFLNEEVRDGQVN